VKHHTLNRKAVAELREQRGMSQVDLAASVGVDNSYISQLEGGSREPSAAVALKIAAALGVRFADITATKDLGEAAQAGAR
jgi:transcriptional regulator with XRE-family HTH domain